MVRAPLDKRAVLAALIDEMERALAVMVQAAKIAHTAATHEEMKPENDKDTRGIEAGYLAKGQSVRAAEIERSLRELRALPVRALAADDPVTVGALVVTEDQDSELRAHVFVAPSGGGVKLVIGAVIIQVVTPSSPLGDALMGKRAGDAVELLVAGRKRELEIAVVS